MTTADTVFAQPGNPDRLRDHEQDARMIFWALLAAILIHLLVAFLLAAFSGFFSPALPAPEKPVELTFMDLSPASMASKNSAFIETDESKNAPEPKDKTFESNANSIGASELAAAGEMPLPSQTGKDRPLMDFESNPYSLDSKGAQAQQKPASQQKAAKPAAQPEPITAAEQFALLTQKSASALDAAAASSQAQSAYRRQKERTHIAGNITNRGISSVNALGTPLGRYQKIVADSIGSRWYTYVEQKRDLISIGTLRLRIYYRSKRTSEESQSYRKQFERVVRQRVRAVGARSASPANSRRCGAVTCRLRAWKWKDSGSLFFLTDDHRLDHCRNGGNRGCRSRIFLEGRPFHVAAAGLFDCVSYDHDFARARVAKENCDAVCDRIGNRTHDAGRKSRTAVTSRLS